MLLTECKNKDFHEVSTHSTVFFTIIWNRPNVFTHATGLSAAGFIPVLWNSSPQETHLTIVKH
jgi:hypothetical protein